MESRRRITLYDQMTARNSTSLADLILNDNVVLTDQNSDDTAAAGGSCQLGQSRTLIDILHEDERYDNNNNQTTLDRKSRKALNFMDKLRLKLTLNPKPNCNSNNNNNNNNNDNNYELTQQGNTHQQQNDVVVSAEPEIAAEVSEVSVAEPVGVSLMDLLEETDVETVGFEVSSYRMSDADCEEGVNKCEGEENGEEEEEGAGVVERNCCVCMVRHKGAAFIPCGHTFCRACSREVWVSRGNCPLCNNFILEILDIF